MARIDDDDPARPWRLDPSVLVSTPADAERARIVNASAGANDRNGLLLPATAGAAPISAVAGTADRSARGERARVAAVEGPREIARLGEAANWLARLCNRVSEPRPMGGAHAW